MWIKILTWAYISVGIIGAFAYWPTIRDLYKYKKPSANLASYLIWTFTTGITLLYSIFVLPDLLFRIVSFANFLACAMVLFLRIKINY